MVTRTHTQTVHTGLNITFQNPNQLKPQQQTLSVLARTSFFPPEFILEDSDPPWGWKPSARQRVRLCCAYLLLTWPGLANREARGCPNSSSILPKTVPSLRCLSPSPSGLGALAAGLEHLSSARGASKHVSAPPTNALSRCLGLLKSRHLTESQCGGKRWKVVRSFRQSALFCARVA